MKVLTKGITKNQTPIQIEEWNENYLFMPYGSTIAAYPISKASHKGSFAPKANETFRAQFDFNSHDEAMNAYNNLISGDKTLPDYRGQLRDKKYQDCI